MLLDGERIARLGRPDEVRAADGAAVPPMDYGDATLLPGLVDAHTHLVAPGDGTFDRNHDSPAELRDTPEPGGARAVIAAFSANHHISADP